MKIDLMNLLYTASLIVLAFVVAVVVTKMISKYTKIFEEKDEE